MKKVFQVISTAGKGFFAFLDALDFLGLLFVVLLFVVGVLVYLLSNFTTIDRAVLVIAVCMVLATLVVTVAIWKRKKSQQ
jgi:Mn2+/Fe2+ NRAMP family transporter